MCPEVGLLGLFNWYLQSSKQNKEGNIVSFRESKSKLAECLDKLEKETSTHKTKIKRGSQESFYSIPCICKFKAKLSERTLEDPIAY